MAWAFKQERIIKRGSIYTDKPGAGKTVQIIT